MASYRIKNNSSFDQLSAELFPNFGNICSKERLKELEIEKDLGKHGLMNEVFRRYNIKTFNNRKA